MSNLFEPGTYVTLAGAPDWGIGQVQCVVGSRVTVNFEHAGKRLINTAHADLRTVARDDIEHQEPRIP